MLDGLMAAVSSGLIMVLAFLFVLTVVVFVHEFGHFIVARWCGVTVKTFSIGFGRELWARVDSRGTRWRIAAVPLGGYVKFLDDANAASAPSEEKLSELTPEERKGAFQTKPLWQRSAVVFAGPFANFVLAAVIYSLINFFVGVRGEPPVIDTVTPGSPAAEAGIRPGDVVVSIDGTGVETFDDVLRTVSLSADKPLGFVIERGGQTFPVTLTPVGREYKDSIGVTLRIGEIGIKSHLPPQIGEVQPGYPAAKAGLRRGDVIKSIDGTPVASFDDLASVVNKAANREITVTVERQGTEESLAVTPVSRPQQKPTGEIVCVGRIGIAPVMSEARPVGPVEAVRRGIAETGALLSQAFFGIGDLILGRQPLSQVGGPILMAEVTARALDSGVERVLLWMAFFSANIGLLNLLPIPLLDGGHLMFYALEAIRRRPLSAAVQEVFFKIGLAMVLTLMVVAFSNDIGRKLGLGNSEPAVEAPKC